MKVVIVGAGPTGLFVADQLLKNSNVQVELYDQRPSVGNKFLVAGKSGLNITHSQSVDEFSKNYFQHTELFRKWFEEFSNKDLVEWLHELGVETFIGSSGRIFPKDFKAAHILQKWKERLSSHHNFKFFPQSKLSTIDSEKLIINDEPIRFDFAVFALGGGSWSKTGSDGKWVSLFQNLGVEVLPFSSLNCGFNIQSPKEFLKGEERIPIKYINVSWGDQSIKGDLMLTPWGIEGSPIYYLSHFIQNDKLFRKLSIDLLPDKSIKDIEEKLIGKKSMSTKLKKILDHDKLRLLKACLKKEEFLDPKILVQKIKNLPIKLLSPRDIDEAISTRGGICFSQVDESLALKKHPNLFVGGEMLNWDAPTGGYLLQGCFTQGHLIAKSILSSIS